MSPHAPPEPPLIEEYAISWVIRRVLFRDIIPEPARSPPKDLGPHETVRIPRAHEEGTIDAVLFPADDAKGLCILAPPGLPYGKSYFWRGPRIPALRDAGWNVLTFDWSGFGATPPTRRLSHVDAGDVLDWSAAHSDRLTWWGVSIGGYWAHLALTRPHTPDIEALVWEECCSDLLRYGFRTARQQRVARLARRSFPNAAAFLPAIAHAPYLPTERAFYIGGADDHLAGPWSAPDLAEAARLRVPHVDAHLVPDAGHLECLKKDPSVLERALGVLER